MYKMVITRI